MLSICTSTPSSASAAACLVAEPGPLCPDFFSHVRQQISHCSAINTTFFWFFPSKARKIHACLPMGYYPPRIQDALPRHVLVVIEMGGPRAVGWEIFEAHADLSRSLGWRGCQYSVEILVFKVVILLLLLLSQRPPEGHAPVKPPVQPPAA